MILQEKDTMSEPKSPNFIAFQKVIDQIENIKSRPQCFVGSKDDIAGMDNLLWGLKIGIRLLIHDKWCYSKFNEIAQKHGYEMGSSLSNMYQQMRERGMSGEEIMKQRLQLEIEMYQELQKKNK